MNIYGNKLYNWGGISNECGKVELIKNGALILLSDTLSAQSKKKFASLPHKTRSLDKLNFNTKQKQKYRKKYGQMFLVLGVVKKDFLKSMTPKMYRWCITELYAWNGYNFINQCHSNKFN